MTIGIAIPVRNGAKELQQLLPLLCAEAIGPILVVDSESLDNTPEIVAAHPGVALVTIRQRQFNHGATREWARKQLATDVVVFLTQDVIPQPGFLQELTAPILENLAVVTYARQVAHDGADIFESFPREFNYPNESHSRTIADVSKDGVYTFFCSDSCAAYSNKALDAIGGFGPTLTNEDYFAVARLLAKGGTVRYVAEAVVRHSHRYTLAQEFQRYFDTGYVRAENRWVNELAGHAERRGSAFARTLLMRMLREAPHFVPYTIMQLFVKWLGFRVGFWSIDAPTEWCRVMSSQSYYWSSIHNRRHPNNRRVY